MPSAECRVLEGGTFWLLVPCSRLLFPAEGLEGGDEDEPVLEEVGEEEEDVPVSGDLEECEAGEAEGVEGDGDVAGEGLPAEADDEEGEHVGLVEPFVEALVVTDAAEVEPFAEEEVAEVGEEGDEGAGEGPAEDGDGTGDAEGSDEPHFGGHGDLVEEGRWKKEDELRRVRGTRYEVRGTRYEIREVRGKR